MNAQGEKTGGRQKGTPNKITASVKYMFKALMMNNYDLVEDSFQKAKPNERLNFIAKMTPFICAKEQPGKNGGEWVMDQNMDHEWFQMYESDHLLRRKQRIEHEENYAIQDVNSQYAFEWQMIHDACAQFNKLGMNGEEEKEMLLKRIGDFFNEQKNEKDKVREIFQQRRENFKRVEQEFFNEENEAEETEEVTTEEAKAEANKQSDEPVQSEEKAQVEECNPLSEQEKPRLNPSTLDTPTPSFSVGGASGTAKSAAESQHLNPSTLDPKPSSNLRLLKQQQRPHRPFYSTIANKRRR